MNLKRRHLLVASLLVLGLLILAWPTIAQSLKPPHPPDELRDPSDISKYVLNAASPSSPVPLTPTHITGNDPRAWTRLAFTSHRDNNWEIYTANGDGSGATRLTDNTAIDLQPDLNRGASRIAFVSNRDGNYEIYTKNTDGSGLTRLTYTSAENGLPRWSPDGSKIAFYSFRDQVNNNGNAEIYVMNADGSDQTRLTFDLAWDGHPAWSPDGQYIAFASKRTGSYEIFKMSATGGVATQLTSGATYAAYPDWSPDGSTILFNYDAALADTFYDVAKVSATGGPHTLVALAPANMSYRAPKWDPTGQYYAYAKISWTFSNNQWRIAAANIPVHDLATSQDIWLLANSGLIDMWPAWATSDIATPASQVTTLPVWTNTSSFTVNWSGTDNLSGLASYDLQYQDNGGLWTDWLIQTTQTSALFNGLNGHTYAFRSRARDYAGNVEAYPATADASTALDTTPPTAAASSPYFTSTLSFKVTWLGADVGSGVASYDVQSRDGAITWTNWLTGATSTSALFNGQYGHTYSFRARAHDHAGNVSAYAANGDSTTTVYKYGLVGRVLNNRAQPVAVAAIQSEPAALNTALSRYSGEFDLYYGADVTVTLTVTRGDFGPLPPLFNMPVSGVLPSPIFYLPPLDNVVSDSHFENDDLAAWNPSGASGDFTPTITTMAHTGHYAAFLGGIVPSDTLTSAPWRSTIVQTVAVSPSLTGSTLALLYRVESVDPLSDTFTAYVIGAADMLTFTLPLTATGWMQQWFDLSVWPESTAMLQLELTTVDQDRPVGIVIDEVTWGAEMSGGSGIFLPLISR